MSPALTGGFLPLSHYDLLILLLGIRPKETYTYVHQKTCIKSSIIALFVVAKTWEIPKCSSLRD